MMPKAFLATDLGVQLAETQAELRVLRKRLDATKHQVDTQRRRIEALRKRVARSASRQKPRQDETAGQRHTEDEVNH